MGRGGVRLHQGFAVGGGFHLGAVRAGTEWGLFQALRNNSCSATATMLDLSADTGFWVSVQCFASTFNEGQTVNALGALTAQTVTIYRIEATACNSATCPDPTNATSPGYIERKRQVIATN